MYWYANFFVQCASLLHMTHLTNDIICINGCCFMLLTTAACEI